MNLRTFFVRESNNNKKDKKSVSIKTRNSIKDSKVQSVAECDNSLNLQDHIWLTFLVEDPGHTILLRGNPTPKELLQIGLGLDPVLSP